MHFTTLFQKIRALPTWYLVGGAAIVVALVVGVQFFTKARTLPQAPAAESHVRVQSVATLSAPAGPLVLTGKVTSLAQANILAQTSGQVTHLLHSIGDVVAAGTIIATFENSSQSASVEQAQGAYAVAEASLGKASGTTATNAGITAAQAAQNVANARTAATASLQSAAAALDDAIHARADLLFTNPKTSSPALTLTVPNSQLVSTLISERRALQDTFTQVDAVVNAPNPDIDAASAILISSAQQVQAFLDNLITAVNSTPPSQTASAAALAASQASLSVARSEGISAVASLSAAKGAYDGAVTGSASASNSAGGGTTHDITIAQANVMQALGALNAARANLEKTLVRAPISGTIVSLPISQGDFVSAFSPVAVVSNPGALYVDAQVTADDAKTLAVSASATIDGGVMGTVTFIAPALDPATGKIEVKVGLTKGATVLTAGTVVSLTINRTVLPTTSVTASSGEITIPIIAVKILPTGPVVFTVDASQKLVAHPIALGSILGDQVVVTHGLVPELVIVTDARGLSEGQTVAVDTP